MPDLSEFKKKMQEIEAAVRAALPEVATTLTLSAKALSERNIREKGFGANYSLNKIPAWFLEGKELNGAGSAFLKKVEKQKQDKGLTNWKEFREAQGLQTAHVDLGYTNKMWANMGPLGVQETGDLVIVPLGATNDEAQKEMEYNKARYGDFIGKSLGKDEIDLLGNVVADAFAAIIDNLQIT